MALQARFGASVVSLTLCSQQASAPILGRLDVAERDVVAHQSNIWRAGFQRLSADGGPYFLSRVTRNDAMTDHKRPRGRPPSPHGPKPRAEVQRACRERRKAVGKASSSATQQLSTAAGNNRCRPLVTAQVAAGVNLALGSASQAGQSIAVQGQSGALANIGFTRGINAGVGVGSAATQRIQNLTRR